MSRVPVSWSMMPAAMNSEALKVAWLRMWNTAATAPTAACQPEQQGDQPEVADGRVGEQPLQVVLEERHVGAEDQRRQADRARPRLEQHRVPASTGYSRASRKTPAFTIVAECR